jgi:hypothetical protein
MMMLDLVGTLAGAAFLAGSVALALLVDRRESTRDERFSGAEEAPASERPAPLRRQLRLVRGTDG